MNKQFNIKPAQLLNNITKSATKLESTNILKFSFFGKDKDGPRCCDFIPEGTNIIALPQ